MLPSTADNIILLSTVETTILLYPANINMLPSTVDNIILLSTVERIIILPVANGIMLPVNSRSQHGAITYIERMWCSDRTTHGIISVWFRSFSRVKLQFCFVDAILSTE